MAYYLIRHLEPRGARGLCYGRRNLPCDERTFLSEAAALRARLPERVLRDSTMFSSPLSRCCLLAQALGAPRMPSNADELIELDFGAWEGHAGVIRAALAASGALAPEDAAGAPIAYGSLYLIDPAPHDPSAHAPQSAQEYPCTAI